MRIPTLVVTLGLTLISAASIAQDDRRADSALSNLDTDGDGSISFVEFQEADGGQFDNADSNGDGALSLDEFLAMGPGRGGPMGPRGDADQRPERNSERMAQMQARMQERMTEQFAEMDSNGDQQLSRLEMQEAAFLRMDSNSDGLIAGRELRRMGRGPDGGAGPQAGRRPPRQGQFGGN
jgi:Ca2+-binding EF-hand superfamily protein